ncbi:hypothetical protein IBL26_24270, partial [Roseomonas aerophila]|nr:hypothetical protein [Pseudoroseomonas aerophila]
MPGTARSALPLHSLLLFVLLLGGGVLLRPVGVMAQAAAPPAASTPQPAAPVPPDSLAALDGILATLKNDTSRAAFVADLERLRASLVAQGNRPAAPAAAAPENPAPAPA